MSPSLPALASVWHWHTDFPKAPKTSENLPPTPQGTGRARWPTCRDWPPFAAIQVYWSHVKCLRPEWNVAAVASWSCHIQLPWRILKVNFGWMQTRVLVHVDPLRTLLCKFQNIYCALLCYLAWLLHCQQHQDAHFETLCRISSNKGRPEARSPPPWLRCTKASSSHNWTLQKCTSRLTRVVTFHQNKFKLYDSKWNPNWSCRISTTITF